MPITARILLGCALALMGAQAPAQDPVAIVLSYGLEEIESPGPDPWKAAEWARKYALDDLSVHVRTEQGKLILAQRVNHPGPFPPEHETASIRYVLTRAGRGYETQLNAVFKDGRPQKALAANVMSIVPRGSELLLFSGSMHVVDTGAIHRVASADANPEVGFVTLLPEAPQVVVEDPGRQDRSLLYIVGSRSLMSISKNNFLKTHYWGYSWSGRYPTSAVLLNNHLVIGSSTGVVVARMQQDIVLSVRYFATKGRSVRLHNPAAKQ